VVGLPTGGRLGKLTVGPAAAQAVADAYAKHPDIRNVAIAGLNGHGDFMALLRLSDEEYEIAIAVVNAQEEILRQRREQGGY
jgi:hypothetical protein